MPSTVKQIFQTETYTFTNKREESESIKCVLYNKKANLEFRLDYKEFTKWLNKIGLIYYQNTLINLEIDGNKYQAFIKNMQIHPTTHKVLHLEFYLVDENINPKFTIKVPVIFTNMQLNLITIQKKKPMMQLLRHVPISMIDVDLKNVIRSYNIDLLNYPESKYRVRDLMESAGISRITMSPASAITRIK